ncbi:uncharacterized protein LOC125233345 [Leguminivora glycinivorella]|uniref:uncharacterized protein LOC125233345 n=1 Tax=Leguminivora glycinivorella TaxID=1035111 RepID=UPI00200C6CFF|nr:uncharacterized protein LOC125233345 [Leguminivora glycinivorella]
MNTKKIELQENLYLVDSEFGWILTGKPDHATENDLTVLTYFQTSCENKLTNPDPPLDVGNVKVLWELESIGITDAPNTDRDEEAIKKFNETTTIMDNRYVVSWPWNEYPPKLPTNFGLAYGRLVSLVKRLEKDALLLYERTLQDQLDKEIIEVVPNDRQVDHPVHFLAHHGISSSEKAMRIVYDASAKGKESKSLNECLYRGPIMLEDLTGLLIKFRCHQIALTADVEKAFLQIGLNENDRDVTRFLWLKDINKPVSMDNLIAYRFTRVPFGIISSPYLLNATIKHHLSRSTSEQIKNLANDIYVDNLLTGVNNIKEATQLYNDCKMTFKQISMNIREWNSNCKELGKAIPEINNKGTVKTLGLDWNLCEDTLKLRTKPANNTFTKRGILKAIASIYDPCGLAAPVVLPAKLLLQSLWIKNVKWDSPLSKEIITDWTNILKDLEAIKEICVPRNISNEETCQIHCFTDASVKAYSAVVYILQKNNLKFIIGKTRLTPIKDQDNLKIARLELLGAIIGNRLIQYVIKYLPIKVTKQTLWCDSQIVIHWWQSNKLLAPFVARRIEEIKKNKDLDLRYIPSELNPADVATRPLKDKEELQFWLNGPEFLLQSPTKWPSKQITDNSFLAREGLSSNAERGPDDIIDEQEQDIISKNNIHKEISDNDQSQIKSSGADNRIESEIQEIIRLQKQHFPEEYNGKKTHLGHNLRLFTDVDGVIRSEGRLTHTDLSYETKHPILLPKNCEFTNRIIKQTHEENYHVGVPHTLSKIRQKFWIPQGRAQVQKIINKCPQCVKYGGGPYTLPKTPALPPERINYETPFTYVGVDYFGPMFVKMGNNKEKRWICLLTCLVVRAIHLEVVKDMSTEECALAFRRFIADRGTPSLIISDNALQFKLLSEVIKEGNLPIQWKFIPQLAPWHGGVYERLVAVVKHCLKRTLEKHLLGDNQLITVIREVTAIVNTRPLTYVGNDLEHVLKPADFLTPGKCINIDNITDNISSSSTSTKQILIEGWKRGEMILKEYKDMFVNQYLLSLRERYKQSPKQARVQAKDAPRVGDIVQIKGDQKNRGTWKVGRISELIKGIDGQCRVAKVKVGNTIFIRSLAHLYPLEAEDATVSVDPAKDISNDQSSRDEEEMDLDIDVNIPVHIDNVKPRENRSTEEIVQNNILSGQTSDSVDMGLEVDGSDKVEIMDTSEDMSELLSTQGDINEEVQNTEDSMVSGMPSNERQKRAAAVQAMEKIKQWSRHLLLTLTSLQ